MVYSIEDCRKT